LHYNRDNRTCYRLATDQGFDEFLGTLGGADLFMEENDPNAMNSEQEFEPIDNFLWRALRFNARYNCGDLHNTSAASDDAPHILRKKACSCLHKIAECFGLLRPDLPIFLKK
jgi:hypothetical protein